MDDKDNVWIYSTRECFYKLKNQLADMKLTDEKLREGVDLEFGAWITGSKLVSGNSNIAYYDHLTIHPEEYPESVDTKIIKTRSKELENR